VNFRTPSASPFRPLGYCCCAYDRKIEATCEDFLSTESGYCGHHFTGQGRKLVMDGACHFFEFDGRKNEGQKR